MESQAQDKRTCTLKTERLKIWAGSPLVSGKCFGGSLGQVELQNGVGVEVSEEGEEGSSQGAVRRH